MSDSRRAREGAGLVDLPLQPWQEIEAERHDERGNLSLFPEAEPDASDPTPEEAPAALPLPLAEEEPSPAADAASEPPADPGADGDTATEDLHPAPFGNRLLAGLADLVVHLAVLAGGVTAMALLDLEPRLEDVPGVLTFVLAFSFLYTVVPLAFWGQTPGMAWGGTRAMDRGLRPLTFGQTGLRWLGGLLTGGLLGLPFVTALFGPSPADLLSGSRTFRAGTGGPREGDEAPRDGG